MIIKLRYLSLVNCALLLLLSIDAFAGGGPPNARRCGGGWRMTAVTTNIAFGQFSIDSGSGGVNISSAGARTPVGDVGLSSGAAFNAYQLSFDNRRGIACLGFDLDIDWRRAPRDLTGPGTDLALNVLADLPAASITGATLPINVPANTIPTLPFIMTFYGDISATFPQTGGAYRSRNMRVQISQGGRNRRGPRFRATATSITPMTLSQTFPMDFGTVAGGSLPGTVILSPTGARSATGDGQFLAAGPGTAATFQLTGDPNLTYIVTFVLGVLESPAGQQMTVDNFTTNSLGTIPAVGVESFQIGATLNINSLQPAGVYSTSTGGGSPYTVTVNYN